MANGASNLTLVMFLLDQEMKIKNTEEALRWALELNFNKKIIASIFATNLQTYR